jgi:hypothetical protein
MAVFPLCQDRVASPGGLFSGELFRKQNAGLRLQAAIFRSLTHRPFVHAPSGVQTRHERLFHNWKATARWYHIMRFNLTGHEILIGVCEMVKKNPRVNLF